VDLIFQWDVEKADSNLRKHGVSFDEAASVFADPLSITISDAIHSATEDRLVTIGESATGRIIVVAHTERDHTIRIISARMSTRRERRDYERGNL
jgi:uncharacterized DUF497 family protein